jgi:segregation and condensation protein B
VEEPALQTPDDIEVDAVHEEANGASASDLTASEDPGDLDDESYLKGVLEALLFSADHPMSAKELARAAQIDRKRATELVELLRKEYENRGLRIELVADGYCFRTHARYRSFVQKFLSLRPVRLSRAQLETLAIVAYRQPVTRPEVDDVRGVDSGQVLKGLLERDLVKILGKKDEPGRPMLYGTSAGFLELFNLTSLKELPSLREFTELSQESRQKYEAELGEDAPAGPIVQEETDADSRGAEDDSSTAEESSVTSETLSTEGSSAVGEMEQSGEGGGAADSDAADLDEQAFDDEESDEESDEDADDEDSDDDDEDSDDDDDSDEESDEDADDEDSDDDDEDSDDDDDSDEESDEDADDEDSDDDDEDSDDAEDSDDEE